LPLEMVMDILDLADKVQASPNDAAPGGDRDKQTSACITEVIVQSLPTSDAASPGRDGYNGKRDTQLEVVFISPDPS
tara:strand:+ start:452 stop:682 length:231 start_codon:yes stop_codon:yes gene_type:complete